MSIFTRNWVSPPLRDRRQIDIQFCSRNQVRSAPSYSGATSKLQRST
jgi:hypothetical protein